MRLILMLMMSLAFNSAHASTEIVRDNGFEIQIQPFPSTFLTQDVAQTYGFERSRRQTLLNVVVLTVQPDGQARGAVPATVTGFVRNLLGQTQTLTFREIDEGEGAIYYLAPVRVASEEEIQIQLEVIPDGAPAIDVDFKRRVYVD
jgi:hypothetical protein